jgi:hypothetical protein
MVQVGHKPDSDLSGLGPALEQDPHFRLLACRVGDFSNVVNRVAPDKFAQIEKHALGVVCSGL